MSPGSYLTPADLGSLEPGTHLCAFHRDDRYQTAREFREALDNVGQILGQLTPDDVLGRIFATFCIGK